MIYIKGTPGDTIVKAIAKSLLCAQAAKEDVYLTFNSIELKINAESIVDNVAEEYHKRLQRSGEFGKAFRNLVSYLEAAPLDDIYGHSEGAADYLEADSDTYQAFLDKMGLIAISIQSPSVNRCLAEIFNDAVEKDTESAIRSYEQRRSIATK